MKSIEFIDAVREKHGLASDRKASFLLGISGATISGIRAGRRKLTGAECQAVADALELPDGYVLAEIEAERASDSDLRRVWRSVAAGILDMAKKGHAAGLASLAIIIMSSGSTENLSAGAASTDLFFGDRIYIIRIWMDVQYLAALPFALLIISALVFNWTISSGFSVTRVTRRPSSRRYVPGSAATRTSTP